MMFFVSPCLKRIQRKDIRGIPNRGKVRKDAREEKEVVQEPLNSCLAPIKLAQYCLYTILDLTKLVLMQIASALLDQK